MGLRRHREVGGGWEQQMTRQQAMGREVTMPQSIVHRAVIQCKRCVLKRDTPTMSPEASGSLGSSLETCTMHAEKLLKTVTADITRHMGNGYWAIGQGKPEQWLMATQAIPVSRYCDCLVHTFRRIPMPPWVTHVKPCHVKGMICLLYFPRIAVNSA